MTVVAASVFCFATIPAQVGIEAITRIGSSAEFVGGAGIVFDPSRRKR